MIFLNDLDPSSFLVQADLVPKRVELDLFLRAMSVTSFGKSQRGSNHKKLSGSHQLQHLLFRDSTIEVFFPEEVKDSKHVISVG